MTNVTARLFENDTIYSKSFNWTEQLCESQIVMRFFVSLSSFQLKYHVQFVFDE